MNNLDIIKKLAFEATRFPSHKITHVLGSRPAPTGLGFFSLSQRRSSKPNSHCPLRLKVGGNNGREAEESSVPKICNNVASNNTTLNSHSSSAEKPLPLNHIQMCENDFLIPHVQGKNLDGYFMEMRG
jgi:hypothetical protein